MLINAAALSSASLSPSDVTVALSYSNFQGRYPEHYNITYFRKVPFAAPPSDHNRFRDPEPPRPIANGSYDSDGTFHMCSKRTVEHRSNQIPGLFAAQQLVLLGVLGPARDSFGTMTNNMPHVRIGQVHHETILACQPTGSALGTRGKAVSATSPSYPPRMALVRNPGIR